MGTAAPKHRARKKNMAKEACLFCELNVGIEWGLSSVKGI